MSWQTVYDQAGITPADLRLMKVMQIKAQRKEDIVCTVAQASDAIEFERNPNPQRHIDAMMWAIINGENGIVPNTRLIKELHARIFPCGGEFRQCDVRISGSSHLPPGWRFLYLIMEDWVNNLTWLLENENDPFMVLAISHRTFEDNHCFADGNGRVGRALINWIAALLDVGIVKLTPEMREEYIQALRDRDDYRLAQIIRNAVV